MGLFDAFRSKPDTSSANGVTSIMVELKVDGDLCLLILLAKDGTINRLGTGAEDNTERGFFIGLSDLEPFMKVRPLVVPIIENWIGNYGAPERKGKPCTLFVGFQTEDGGELISHWEYGSQSQGPPPELAQLLSSAVDATDSWWKRQKSLAATRSE